MTTHVQRLETDVIPAAEPVAPDEDASNRWEEEEELRRRLARMRSLQLRTQAEGFDD